MSSVPLTDIVDHPLPLAPERPQGPPREQPLYNDPLSMMRGLFLDLRAATRHAYMLGTQRGGYVQLTEAFDHFSTPHPDEGQPIAYSEELRQAINPVYDTLVRPFCDALCPGGCKGFDAFAAIRRQRHTDYGDVDYGYEEELHKAVNKNCGLTPQQLYDISPRFFDHPDLLKPS